jgi:hypothetical protein
MSLTCKGCNSILPAEAFYADGGKVYGKCKPCVRAAVMKRRCEKIEQIREYDRNRANQPHRLAARIEYTRGYRKSNPLKYRAHQMVARATRTGKLKKLPCVVCGEEKVEAHHPDYYSPLEVIWACSLHHKQLFH